MLARPFSQPAQQAASGGFGSYADACAVGGCVGDGVTDDTAAWQALVASEQFIYIPAHKNILTTQPTEYATHHHFAGAGWRVSKVTCTHTSESAFKPGPSGGTTADFRDLKIISQGVNADTAAVSIGHATTLCSMVTMQNVNVVGYNGIYFSGISSNHRLVNVHASDCTFAGFNVNTPYPNTIGEMLMCTAWAGAGSNMTGLYVSQCDTANVVQFMTAGMVTPVWLRGNNGVIGQFNITHLSSENYTGGAAVRIGDGGFSVFRCFINGLETLPMNLGGVGAIYLGANALECSFSDVVSGGNSSITDYGTRTSFHNVTMDTGSITLHGSGTQVKNCSKLNNFTASAAADTLDIQGNQFFGTSPSIDAACWPGSIIKNNRGLSDIATSIAAAPLYVGQAAVVGGVGYMATGTASSADWKQVTA